MSTASAKPFKMSDTALKFGPEWLRALSHGDTASSPPPSPGPVTQRYKLADYRYGREEMLALFNKSIKAPDELATMAPLYIEKTMTPLALIQMSEEELRLWQQGINSDVVLKLMGRGSGNVVGGSGAAGPVGRGRGGSMDRGRGRARGGGSSSLRGASYDDEGEHRPGPNTFGRGGARPFERSQSNTERSWPERSERNGNEEWNGPGSPKKEFGRPFQDNWRSREAKERERERERAENKEEDDGWRTAGRAERWGRPGWRGEREPEDRGSRFFPKGDREGGLDEGGRRYRVREEDPRQGGPTPYNAKRVSARPDNDMLPEWASEDLHEGGGTFDSSGAFRGETWSDEDEGGPKDPSPEKVDPYENPLEEKTPQPVSDAAAEVRKSPVKESSALAESSFVAEKIPDKIESIFLSKQDEPLGTEDDLQHAQAVASTLVAQLVEEEEILTPSAQASEQWLYRDPQGHVQGPFGSAEMAEWFSSGYFTMALSVKRTIDERFVQLGELTKMYGGRLPFLPGPTIAPLKAEGPNLSTDQEKLQLLQQQVLQQQLFQQQLLQQQMMLRQQEMQVILAKLTQMDGWSGLSPAQQQQIINHHMMASTINPGIMGTDRLLQQVRAQMEAQAKLQSDILQRKDPMQAVGVPVSHHAKVEHDPIQSFMEQLLGQPKPVAIQKPVAPAAPAPVPKEVDPIQNFLQQMQWGSGPADINGQDPSANHAAPGFQGLVPGQGLVPWPPQQGGHGHFPMAGEAAPMVWDMESSAKAAEEKKRLLEQQQQQQQQLELQRRQEEEERRLKEEEEERKRKEKEEERKRREKEEKEKAEEEERRRLEDQRREAEEQRRREEERQKAEERRRKEEEERRQRDEDLRQQQAEEERIRREEERLAEQQRRQQEALLRLQEAQAAANKEKAKAAAAAAAKAKAQPAVVAPWAQPQKQQPQSTDTLSLAEIQKLQEEKERQQRIAEALKAEQIANLNAAAAAVAAQQKAVTLRWAQQQSKETAAAKSLAEIQAEEAAQLAKLREKEKAERAAQQAALNLTAARAWGSSHHSSAWAAGRPAVAQSSPQWSAKASSNTAAGFWEEPSPAPKPAVQQQPTPQKAAKVAPPSPVKTMPAAAATPAASNSKKNRTKKDEETIKKLFEQKTDAFSQWCHDYLARIGAQLDVPTFVTFLRDVESPFEVQDYVKSYLGEGKDAKEFAKQFLERRSRWRQSQKSSYKEEDNMCVPAKAVNPGHAQEFYEVKGKGKKSKKKMQKVDASLLGFSVTASSDRVNVGERDYVDGM